MSAVSRHFRTRDEEETRGLAKSLAESLVPGDLIALEGSLGAGKSVFVRGLAEGLGITPGRVRSPTFTLINEYSGGRLPLYHIDLYRIEPDSLDQMALREYLYGDGVCAVEWWERLGQGHSCTLRVELTFVDSQERAIVVSATDPRYEAVLDRLPGGSRAA